MLSLPERAKIVSSLITKVESLDENISLESSNEQIYTSNLEIFAIDRQGFSPKRINKLKEDILVPTFKFEHGWHSLNAKDFTNSVALKIAFFNSQLKLESKYGENYITVINFYDLWPSLKVVDGGLMYSGYLSAFIFKRGECL